MKKGYLITGMTCSACSNHIEKAVGKLDGMKHASVSLLTNRMEVDFDSNKLSEEQIIKTVINSGYGIKQKKQDNTVASDELKEMKNRVWISFLLLIPLMYVSMGHMLGLPLPSVFHGIENAIMFSFTQFLITIPIVIVNKKYYIGGFKALKQKAPNMDSLIAIGSSAALIYGIYSIFKIGYGLGHGIPEIAIHYSENLYFESAAMILTLITLGKYLETKSKRRTSEAINKLIDLTPKTATVIREGKEIQISTEDIQKGDRILVRPGETIPVDGKVIEGSTHIDESAITGESKPAKKEKGDKVISATINQTGSIQFIAEKVGEDTTISQIIKLVEEASSSKAPIGKLADKISGVFVPIVIGIAVLATIIWIATGQSFDFALSIGIAVLVISCPCALGLATPVSIMVATGKAAENGILVKSAESLETLHSITTVVFDKTGTITEGKMQLIDIVTNLDSKENLIMIAASLESFSEHPIAKAVLQKAPQKLEQVEDFKAIPGKGIQGLIEGKQYFLGNRKWLTEKGILTEEWQQTEKNWMGEGKTVLWMAEEQKIIGILSIRDTIKQTSKNAISELHKMGMETVLLTGDNKVAAQAIAKEVGITNVIAEVLPQEKEEQIRKLQQNHKKVAMCGDGINDSPSLARAEVGIAVGAGTDIAIEAADVVLIKNDLQDIVTAIKLSKKTIQNIRMNLFWAFFYNSLGIPIAAGLLYPIWQITLSPMLAALAMSLSSVCVVTNALRLRMFKAEKQERKVEKEKMEKKIVVKGMSCEHCKKRVVEGLESMQEVEKVQVNLETGAVNLIITTEIPEERLREKIEEIGYEME